jgi:hypothetical protein
MKKGIFLLFIFLISCGIVSSQEEKNKKDSVKVRNGVEDYTSNTTIGEGQEDDESGNTNFVPGLLHSSQDVFTNNTSYTFSIAYFKERGYDNQYENICINNYLMNSMITGRATYSQWEG